LEVIKKWGAALRERSGELGWSVVGGLIGGGVGLLFAMLWTRGQ
jgi:hypothetical protein